MGTIGLSIASRAISTLIKAQNWGELYRIYRMAKDAGAEYNLLAVPASFDVTTQKLVDPVYQKALFDEGYRLGNGGGPWMHVPPSEKPH